MRESWMWQGATQSKQSLRRLHHVAAKRPAWQADSMFHARVLLPLE
jgi:hypothetical protein